MPDLYIIAGPNGVGKTTYARDFLPEEVRCLEFVNADMIAQGLSPFAPERAPRARDASCWLACRSWSNGGRASPSRRR